jgi:copper(I)-binding protein
MQHTPATRRVAIAAALAALTLGVAGCGTTSATAGTDGAAASSEPLTLTDGWVKAVDVMPADPSPSMSMDESGDGDMEGMDHEMDMAAPMTAMFGTLHNATDEEVTVTGASSPAAGRVELHEVVRTDSGEMQMQPKPGGFVIEAGGDHTLQPGGDHVMFLDLTGSLANGDETTVTLETSAGQVTFTVPVRAFSGAEESYEPGSEPSDS